MASDPPAGVHDGRAGPGAGDAAASAPLPVRGTGPAATGVDGLAWCRPRADPGNKDTTNVNLSFDLTRDPKTRTVFKADGLYILATEGEQENVDRGLINARVERLVTDRAYAFAHVSYVRDRFKDIDSLVAPTAGLGYRVLASGRTTLDVDGSLGVMVEKNAGLATETDGAVASSEKFTHRLSSSAAFTQGATALWAMDDFGDALYTFRAGVAASVTTRVQLKLEFQDVFKTRPTGVSVEKNDIALVTALVYKV